MTPGTSNNQKPLVFFLSYGIREYDGRQDQLISALRRVSDVTVIALSFADYQDKRNEFSLRINARTERSGLLNYFRFAFHSLKHVKKLNQPYILFVDDFTACIAAIVVQLIRPPEVTLLDSREFYYGRKMPGLGRLHVLAERFLSQKAQAVIVANQERAVLSKVLLGLKQKLLVFRNIRDLSGAVTNPLSPSTLELVRRIQSQKIVVSTGGISIERGTLELIRSFSELEGFTLLIIGGGRAEDVAVAESLVERMGISNVILIDRVKLDDLKNILPNCYIGVVEYHQNDLNNVFCASGKVSEFISMGLPMVTTGNISLISEVQNRGIGLSTGCWVNAIRDIDANYTQFKERVEKEKELISVESNIEQLSMEIEQIISRKDSH